MVVATRFFVNRIIRVKVNSFVTILVFTTITVRVHKVYLCVTYSDELIFI